MNLTLFVVKANTHFEWYYVKKNEIESFSDSNMCKTLWSISKYYNFLMNKMRFWNEQKRTVCILMNESDALISKWISHRKKNAMWKIADSWFWYIGKLFSVRILVCSRIHFCKSMRNVFGLSWRITHFEWDQI